MIDEESDDSEDIIISPNSPECCNDVSHENNIISDYSSPLKNDMNIIIETNSPEISEENHLKSVRNESFKKKSRKSYVRRKLLGPRPSLNINISKKVPLLHKLDDSASHATIRSNNKKIRINPKLLEEGVSSGLRKYEESGNDFLSLSPLFPFYPTVPVRTAKLSPNERKVYASYHVTRPYEKEAPSPMYQEASGSGLSFNDSRLKENDISLNSSHDNSKDEEIIDANSQPMRIDELSQEAIIMDSEPIETPSESYVISSRKHSPEKDKLSSNLDQSCPNDKIKQVVDTPLNETKLSFTKAPKKGTLLSRAYKVLSTMKKDSALLSHEINVGLRTSRGSFASDILFVNSISSEEGSFIIECTPLFYICDASNILDSPKATVRVFIYTTALPKEIKVNSRLVVHFPVLAMFDASMKKMVVFSENRTQVFSKELTCSYHQYQSNMKLLARNTSNSNKKIFRLLKNRASKMVLDAVVGNLLIAHSILELLVLYIHTDREKKQIILLTMDNEQQFSILHLGISEMLQVIREIQPDAVYTFLGFRLTKYFDLSSEMKQAAEYYTCGCIANDYMYVFEPVLRDFKINLIKKVEPRLRPLSSVNHFSFLNNELL